MKKWLCLLFCVGISCCSATQRERRIPANQYDFEETRKAQEKINKFDEGTSFQVINSGEGGREIALAVDANKFRWDDAWLETKLNIPAFILVGKSMVKLPPHTPFEIILQDRQSTGVLRSDIDDITLDRVIWNAISTVPSIVSNDFDRLCKVLIDKEQTPLNEPLRRKIEVIRGKFMKKRTRLPSDFCGEVVRLFCSAELQDVLGLGVAMMIGPQNRESEFFHQMRFFTHVLPHFFLIEDFRTNCNIFLKSAKIHVVRRFGSDIHTICVCKDIFSLVSRIASTGKFELIRDRNLFIFRTLRNAPITLEADEDEIAGVILLRGRRGYPLSNYDSIAFIPASEFPVVASKSRKKTDRPIHTYEFVLNLVFSCEVNGCGTCYVKVPQSLIRFNEGDQGTLMFRGIQDSLFSAQILDRRIRGTFSSGESDLFSLLSS